MTAAERSTLDEEAMKIIASLSGATFGTILHCLQDKLGGPTVESRNVDRSLQRLRKAGKIKFAGNCWKMVEP